MGRNERLRVVSALLRGRVLHGRTRIEKGGPLSRRFASRRRAPCGTNAATPSGHRRASAIEPGCAPVTLADLRLVVEPLRVRFDYLAVEEHSPAIVTTPP